MQNYPFTSPIILNDAIFSQYGGQGTGTFPSVTLQAAYQMAEIQVTNYIGAPLLPITVTGTYAFAHQSRIATDYGYVQQVLSVSILTQQNCNDCNLHVNPQACGYVYSNSYGYVDFKRLAGTCGWSWWGFPSSPYVLNYVPYAIQIAYLTGLPTGVATQPTILRALSIVAQTNLNDMFPGVVGQNESVGAIGVQEFASLDYRERRADHALIKTALGDDAMSQRAKKLIDATVKRARKALFA